MTVIELIRLLSEFDDDTVVEVERRHPYGGGVVRWPVLGLLPADDKVVISNVGLR